MNLQTNYFGEIEIDEAKVIIFNEGIPGFPELKKYIFMTDSDENGPFCWLQSIEDKDIVFTIMDVFKFLPEYSPVVEEDELKEFGEAVNDEDLAIYNIVVIPKDIKNITVNLKAPIIINLKNLLAKQVILNNDEYEIKYYIYQELMSKKGGEEQC